MDDLDRTKSALIAELVSLRRRPTNTFGRMGDGTAPPATTTAAEGVAERALKNSEIMYRRLFEAAHDGILILDAGSGEITAVNPFLANLLGYSAEEMLGKKLWEIGPFEDVATSKIHFAELQNNEYIRYEDLPLQARDGRSIDVEFVSNLYEANDQKVIQCNIRDITERKHTEEAAYQSARVTALRAAVGLALSEPGSFVDSLKACAEAFVMHFSAALTQIWTVGEADGALTLRATAGIVAQPDTALDGVPPGHSMIERIVETGEPVITNTATADPQVSDHAWAQREGIVAFAGYPLKVEGRVVGVLGLFAQEPLSEAVLATLNSLPNHLALSIDRRWNSDELAAAEERMRFAMESARIGIWDMDYATGVLRWSEVMEEQYGLARGEFGGTFEEFVERIHPDDRGALQQSIGNALRVGGDFTVHNRSLRPDGTVRWLRGEGRVTLDAQGAPTRAIGISLDVTEQLAVQAQDQQTQKMEAIGRLAGGVAHDFNNLLTVMLGFCELVMSSLRETDPMRADVAEIEKAGQRAAALTRQLLTFSRRSVIEPRLLNVNEVVVDLHSMLARLLGDDVDVVTRLESGTSRVLADRGQVEQVIVNLAVNGRDAMTNGGTLTIESANVDLDENYAMTHLAAKPGKYVVLSVSDTGSGMTPEVIGHLFEPFFTTKEAGMGTGLGLATVHGIVMQNGGSIGVYSELGKGTTIKVYFPLSNAQDALPEIAVPVEVSRGTGETILVVEDADALRAVTRRMLEQGGYTVVVAAGAEEALRIFERIPSIALVLTDVVMPGGNGPELIAQLAARRAGVKVVYMSGYTEDAIVHHGVLASGIAFLPKPFNAATLQRKIREQLDSP